MGGSRQKPRNPLPPPAIKDEADVTANPAGTSQRLLAGLGFKKNFLSPRGPESDATWGKPDATYTPPSQQKVVEDAVSLGTDPVTEQAKLDAANVAETISQHAVGDNPDTANSTQDSTDNWRLNPEGGRRRVRTIY